MSQRGHPEDAEGFGLSCWKDGAVLEMQSQSGQQLRWEGLGESRFVGELGVGARILFGEKSMRNPSGELRCDCCPCLNGSFSFQIVAGFL